MLQFRTSETDPLQIASIQPPAVRGRIGLTFCPGKKGDSLFGISWNRCLETDITAISEWGASAVVSLIEDNEFPMLGVEQLPDTVRKYGMQWLHLPIRDVDVPGTGWLDNWNQAAGTQLRNRLLRGERILLHCRGGLGRTGLVAALILKDLGVDASTAIALVRQARPNAIETSDQENYVTEYRSWTGRQLPANFKGCMLGGAVGDAFGWPVEFFKWPQIESKFGADGLTQPMNNATGVFEVTDDTQMSLFTAEGMVLAYRRFLNKGIGPSFKTMTWHAYQRWLVTQNESFNPGWRPRGEDGWLLQHADLFVRRAPGSTCLSALETGSMGDVEKPINDSKGCGTVMRVAPVGLFLASPVVLGHLDEIDADKEAFRIGCEVSALTHGHPSGWLAGGFLALLIRRLVMGDSLREGINRTKGEMQSYPGHEEVLRAVIKAEEVFEQTAHRPSREAITTIGEGWVAEEALAMSLYCALSYPTDFQKAIQLAINHGGDSDSTGAITGNILGAMLGDEAIPEEWLSGLELQEAVEEVAMALWTGDEPQ